MLAKLVDFINSIFTNLTNILIIIIMKIYIRKYISSGEIHILNSEEQYCNRTVLPTIKRQPNLELLKVIISLYSNPTKIGM